MAKRRRPGLPRVRGGFIRVGTPRALALLMTHVGEDLSDEIIEFQGGPWPTTPRAQAKRAAFINSAVACAVAAGILPPTKVPLPLVGTRAEAMLVGGRPGPPQKYGTGTVTGLGWCSVFRLWRVNVTFDHPEGTYYGHPIGGTSTFPNMVHVIGSPERPFSSMTPAEIRELYDERRVQLWDAELR